MFVISLLKMEMPASQRSHSPKTIEKEHIDNNTAVRDMLVSRGIYPEQLPPAEDVKKVERRLAKGDKDAKTDHNIR